MKIRTIRELHGPNVWAEFPMLEVVLEDILSDAEIEAALRRFPKILLGGEDPFAIRDPQLALAQALVTGLLKLQEMAGTPVGFASTRKTSEAGVIRAAVQFASGPLAREAVAIAWRMLTSPANGPNEPTADDIQRLKDLEYQQRIPPTVATTYYGAKKLGIPVAKLSAEYSGYLIMGQGSKQRRMRWSEPDAVSGVARLASTDKYLTNQLLASIGVPVPRGRLIGKVEDAWAAANEVGLPVAVKPYNCDLQTGVSLDLRTRERVEAAFVAAAEHSSWVLVEHFAPGVEHRVVVVGERVVAVTRIEPPQVKGDGVSSIAKLVETVNQEPRRSGDDRSDAPLSKLKIDDEALAVLASQGYTLESAPAAGAVVLVRRDPPYFKNGGTLSDLTDQIHPSTARHAVAAAHMMQIPVAGLDVVAVDIAKPLEEQQGIIVEINANPGFWLHLAPWADSPRPVGEEVAAWLFPTANRGRIPVVALVGDEGGLVKRQLTALLEQDGSRVGSLGFGEMSAAGRTWPAPAGTPQERAFVLFRNPTVDIALLETDGAELLDHGFGNDRCEVAIVLSDVPTTATDERDPAEFVLALTNALGPTGVFIATRTWSAERLGVTPARVIMIAGPDDDDARCAHLARGGRAVFVRGSDVVLGKGTQAASVLGPAPASELGCELVQSLAALAAASVISGGTP